MALLQLWVQLARDEAKLKFKSARGNHSMERCCPYSFLRSFTSDLTAPRDSTEIKKNFITIFRSKSF
jgi:hypothetical protein